MIYLQLFWSFFLIGCFSFGGGYAMLPLIDRQITNYGWMTTKDFTDVIALSGMLPGSIGINAATFIGYKTAGLLGALIASISMVLPPLLLIILIGKWFKRFQESPTTIQAFYGIKPAIVGLIIYSAIKFALSIEMITSISWASTGLLFIFLFTLLALHYRKVSPIITILISALAGIIFYY